MTTTSVLSTEGRGRLGLTSLSLLDRARNQDQEAWKRLAGLYAPLVTRWCKRAGLSAADTDDIWGEVLLTLTVQLRSFERRREGSFRTWLRAITWSKIGDLFRCHHLLSQGGSTAQEVLAQAAALTPWDSLENEQEEIDSLYRRVLELIQRDFEATTWQAFQGTVLESRRAREVAAETGLSVNAVHHAKARVLKRLREEFRDFLE